MTQNLQVVNLTEITQIIKNPGKINCLIQNLNKKLTLSKPEQKTEPIKIHDHGYLWNFEIVKDVDGKYGVWFIGLETLNSYLS